MMGGGVGVFVYRVWSGSEFVLLGLVICEYFVCVWIGGEGGVGRVLVGLMGFVIWGIYVV